MIWVKRVLRRTVNGDWRFRQSPPTILSSTLFTQTIQFHLSTVTPELKPFSVLIFFHLRRGWTWLKFWKCQSIFSRSHTLKRFAETCNSTAKQVSAGVPVAPCKVIQESLGFRIRCLWIPDSTSMDSGFHNQQPGFWITIMIGFRILKPWTPDSTRIPQTKITWIPDYLTWGDSSV